jgi:hypothetical protein
MTAQVRQHRNAFAHTLTGVILGSTDCNTWESMEKILLRWPKSQSHLRICKVSDAFPSNRNIETVRYDFDDRAQTMTH